MRFNDRFDLVSECFFVVVVYLEQNFFLVICNGKYQQLQRNQMLSRRMSMNAKNIDGTLNENALKVKLWPIHKQNLHVSCDRYDCITNII